jgi:hypothetical protein
MPKATIPCDGQWHELPERPIRSITAPITGEVDIKPRDSVGIVRFPPGPYPDVEVEYEVAR